MGYSPVAKNYGTDYDRSGAASAVQNENNYVFPWLRYGGFGTSHLVLAFPDMMRPPIEQGDLIEFHYEDGTIWYQGVVRNIILTPKVATAKLQGYPFWCFRNQYPNTTYESKTLDYIVNDLADNYAAAAEPTAMAKEIDVPDVTLNMRYYDGKDTLAQVLTNLAEQFGCWWCLSAENPRKLYFVKSSAIDSVKTYREKSRTDALYEPEAEFGNESLENVIQVRGGWDEDTGERIIVEATNATSITKRGRYRAPDICDRSIADADDATAVGESYLEGRGDIAQHFRGRALHNANATAPFPWLYRVRCQNHDGTYFGTFYIERGTVTFGESFASILWGIGDPKSDTPGGEVEAIQEAAWACQEARYFKNDDLGEGQLGSPPARNPAIRDLDMDGHEIDDCDNILLDPIDGMDAESDAREWLNAGRLSALTGDSGVIAVGDSGKILRRGASDTWAQETSGVAEDLNAAHGTSLRGARVVGAHDGADMMILDYHSRSWARFTTGEVSMDNLNGIWSSSDATIWACGDNGFVYVRARQAGLVQQVADGAIKLNAIYGTELRSSRALGACDVFAVGDEGRIFHYEESGEMFRFIEQDSPTDQDLLGVWGASVASGYKMFAVGKAGTVLHYDGVSWTIHDSGTDEDLYAVWGSSLKNVFAVGTNGTVRHYNGTSWASAGYNITGGGTLVGISGTSYKRFFAVNSVGQIWGRKAGNWSEETVTGGAVPLNAVFAVNADLLHRHGDEEEQSGEPINEDNFATLALSAETPQPVQATGSAGAGTKASDDKHVHGYTLSGATPLPLDPEGGSPGNGNIPPAWNHRHGMPSLEDIIGEEGEIIGLSEEKPLGLVDVGAEVPGDGEEAAPWNHQHPGITNPLSRALNCNWKDVYYAMLTRCRVGNAAILEKGGFWRDDSENTFKYHNGTATYDLLFMR